MTATDHINVWLGKG